VLSLIQRRRTPARRPWQHRGARYARPPRSSASPLQASPGHSFRVAGRFRFRGSVRRRPSSRETA